MLYRLAQAALEVLAVASLLGPRASAPFTVAHLAGPEERWVEECIEAGFVAVAGDGAGMREQVRVYAVPARSPSPPRRRAG